MGGDSGIEKGGERGERGGVEPDSKEKPRASQNQDQETVGNSEPLQGQWEISEGSGS